MKQMTTERLQNASPKFQNLYADFQSDSSNMTSSKFWAIVERDYCEECLYPKSECRCGKAQSPKSSNVLTDCTKKVKHTYAVKDDSMLKASRIMQLEHIKPVGTTNNFRVHSLTRNITYYVKMENLECQCEDWKHHNNAGDETKHLCIHIIAVLLYRAYHAEVQRQEEERIANFTLAEYVDDLIRGANVQTKEVSKC